MKTTRYFEAQVLRKRPYVQRDWCQQAIARPPRREIHSDGRVRFWTLVADPGGDRPRYLRVVTLADGETIHNAFFDRDFRRMPNEASLLSGN